MLVVGPMGLISVTLSQTWQGALKVPGLVLGTVVVSLQEAITSGSGDLGLSCDQVLSILHPEYLETDRGRWAGPSLGWGGESLCGDGLS